jgi:electron transfer flavoprotein alpha/beta subunit
LEIVQAAGKEIVEMAGCDCEPFGITPYEMGLAGSPTRVLRVFESRPERTVEMIQGDPQEAAHRLLEKLHAIGVLS